MDVIRVLIADDHAFFRKGLRGLLQLIPEVELVGEAESGAQALALAGELQPDVVLMDVQMPDMNGIDATRAVLAMSPHMGVLMLTMFDDDDTVFAAMRVGARGYLLKGADRGEIGRAIKAVRAGEAIFSPPIAQRLMHYFAAPQPARSPAFPELTDREREVLDLIAQGLSNTDIAARLVLSGKTVRNHVSNIFAKLQVAGRAEAIVRARTEGLGGAGR
jgi:DNA-binding NarL/FixJ family response regulator